ENEIYLGNTVNMKYSTKSYKDKRRVEHPREECMVFENTHPALITREVWDMVQRVRKNKRRLTKMEEQNKYSGLVFCADCGSNMVLHRAHTMSASYNHFICRTYKKDGEACTGHYIRECDRTGGPAPGDERGAGTSGKVRRLHWQQAVR
ncbi:recombinase zinc beta ribbon domain-containing protein, partial [Dysosmobacter sp.]|uniref:recombinase zinc beta ribbon domain-containing protein n=1 Tax=Dysosmobacter sp. TaxID=2591382 RepID=UPI003AEF3FBC